MVPYRSLHFSRFLSFIAASNIIVIHRTSQRISSLIISQEPGCWEEFGIETLDETCNSLKNHRRSKFLIDYNAAIGVLVVTLLGPILLRWLAEMIGISDITCSKGNWGNK